MLIEVQLIWTGWTGSGQIQICPMYPHSGAQTEGVVAVWRITVSRQIIEVQEASLNRTSTRKASAHTMSTTTPLP